MSAIRILIVPWGEDDKTCHGIAIFHDNYIYQILNPDAADAVQPE